MATLSEVGRKAVSRTQPPARWAGLREVLGIFVATRVALILVTYVGDVLVQAPNYSETSVGLAGMLAAWDRWDALHYLAIARDGYTTVNNTAFFPLYPLLIGIVTAPFHGQGGYVVGLILANLAFLAALMMFWRLVTAEWGPAVAGRATIVLAIFPGALYSFAPYNESLFLLFSIGCFLALRQRRWAVAGVLGELAVLTRAAGILLLIPFAYEWWCATRATRAAEASASAEASQGASWSSLAWALLIPAGLAAYAAYCAQRFGDPLAFAHAQAHWNRVLTWPWVGVWWQIQGLAQAAPASFFQVHDLLDLGATLLMASLLAAGWRMLPRAQSLYLAALLLLVVSEPGGVRTHLHDPLTSNLRFAVEMFPGFVTLALLTRQRPQWYQGIVVVSVALLAALALIFVLGRWLV